MSACPLYFGICTELLARKFYAASLRRELQAEACVQRRHRGDVSNGGKSGEQAREKY